MKEGNSMDARWHNFSQIRKRKQRTKYYRPLNNLQYRIDVMEKMFRQK